MNLMCGCLTEHCSLIRLILLLAMARPMQVQSALFEASVPHSSLQAGGGGFQLRQVSFVQPLKLRRSSSSVHHVLRVQAKKLDSSEKNVKQADNNSSGKTPATLPAKDSSSKSTSSKYPTPSDDYFDPGMVPDFWEGPQWNWLGFTMKYLWAIGIVVALITCGILFATYKPRPGDYRGAIPEVQNLEEVEKILEDRRSNRNSGGEAAPELVVEAPQVLDTVNE